MLTELKIVEENKTKDELIIKVPEDWWIASYSYPLFNDIIDERKSLKVIPFKKIKTEKLTIPKPNYWDISQGDYHVHEDYRSLFSQIQNRKKFFFLSFYLFLIFGSTILYFLT